MPGRMEILFWGITTKKNVPSDAIVSISSTLSATNNLTNSSKKFLERGNEVALHLFHRLHQLLAHSPHCLLYSNGMLILYGSSSWRLFYFSIQPTLAFSKVLLAVSSEFDVR